MKKKKNSNKQKRTPASSPEAIPKLRDELSRMSPRSVRAIRLALFAGVRPAEIAACRWNSVYLGPDDNSEEFPSTGQV